MSGNRLDKVLEMLRAINHRLLTLESNTSVICDAYLQQAERIRVLESRTPPNFVETPIPPKNGG